MSIDREIWSVDDFKAYVRRRIDKDYYDTASMVVLRSFYLADVIKPVDVTVRMFFWLRSIAEKEIQVYKSLKTNTHHGKE